MAKPVQADLVVEGKVTLEHLAFAPNSGGFLFIDFDASAGHLGGIRFEEAADEIVLYVEDGATLLTLSPGLFEVGGDLEVTGDLAVTGEASILGVQFLAFSNERAIRFPDPGGGFGQILYDADGDGMYFKVATGSTTFTVGQTSVSVSGRLNVSETGSWSPTIQGSGNNPTVSYSLQVGSYLRIGPLVYVSGRITVSSISGGSGNLRIGSLPYACGGFARFRAPLFVTMSGINYLGLNFGNVFALPPISQSYLEVFTYATNTSYANLALNTVGNGDDIMFSGFYWTQDS